MDRPRPRGLAAEVGNLVILAFAELTNRSFFLHGRPFVPGLDRLPDGVELRLQPLPSEAEWEEARGRAVDLFGFSRDEPALRTAANVAALAVKVQAKAGDAGPSCHALVREARQALARLGADDAAIAQAPRARTALAVDALLTGLDDPEPTAVVQHLARARLDTSAPAMGTSLARAGAVAAALREARWELFDAVAQVHDERQGKAEALLEALRSALSADEFAQPLVARLEQAEVEAIRLLTPKGPPKPSGPGPGPGPKPGAGWRTIREGEHTITPETAAAELEELARLLRDGEGPRRLVLSWRLEQEEPAG
jgi:hypothetical protein